MSFLQDVENLIHTAHTDLTAGEAKLKAWFAHMFASHKAGNQLSSPPQAGSAVAPTPGVVPTPTITAPPPPAPPTPSVSQRAGLLPLPAGAHLVAIDGMPMCLVTLDLPTDAAQYGWAFSIDEVKNCFAEGSVERTTIEANSVQANGEYEIGTMHTILAAHPLSADGRTIDRNKPVAHTNALPPVPGYATVAEAIVTLSALKRASGAPTGPFLPTA